jgi:hypothetical protein
VVKRCLEQLCNRVFRCPIAIARPRTRLCAQHLRQTVEKLTQPRRQQLFEPGERVIQVGLERRAGHRFEQVTAQIERAQFGHGEAGFESFQHLAIKAPVHVAVLVPFIEQWEPRLLERGEITSNRPCRDIEVGRQRRDRHPMPGGFQRVQDLPLPNDLLVARHGSSYVRRLGGVFSLWSSTILL